MLNDPSTTTFTGITHMSDLLCADAWSRFSHQSFIIMSSACNGQSKSSSRNYLPPLESICEQPRIRTSASQRRNSKRAVLMDYDLIPRKERHKEVEAPGGECS
ncbi:unnamed protein product [Nippostrongylus brasiliensis]|uniref:Uncharacterized protein n=1 Tax=Nippostrongylus brasiliensis TaxID=27835 RepID=A0A0N4Y5I9_NIPBR|nr:unnamed protein product [Nippostrongylus brasiliensis]